MGTEHRVDVPQLVTPRVACTWEQRRQGLGTCGHPVHCVPQKEIVRPSAPTRFRID